MYVSPDAFKSFLRLTSHLCSVLSVQVVTKIENLKVNKLDKPYDTVKMMTVEVKQSS